MRMRRPRPVSTFTGVAAAVVMVLTGACSSGSDGAGPAGTAAPSSTDVSPSTDGAAPDEVAPDTIGDASLSSFVERVAWDDDGSPFAVYFSLDRYRAGTDVADDLGETELLSEVFVESRAEPTIADPYSAMLALNRAEPVVVPLAPLGASYTAFGDSGSILMGDFDPDAIGTSLEDLDAEVTETPAGSSYRIPDEGPAAQLYGDESILVADDAKQIVFGAEGDGSGAVAGDGSATAADEDGTAEVAAALDDENVYAAALFFDGSDTASADDAILVAPWVRAGLGTSIEDGESRAVMVLGHGDDRDAEANTDRAGDLLGELAECTGDADVTREGPLVVASCGIEEAGFVQNALSRAPMTALYD